MVLLVILSELEEPVSSPEFSTGLDGATGATVSQVNGTVSEPELPAVSVTVRASVKVSCVDAATDTLAVFDDEIDSPAPLQAYEAMPEPVSVTAGVNVLAELVTTALP
ncbi:MAG: hypothetical protein RBT68_03075, partial [Spirochaetia bacterium]|nr:hypothetical protein [Spirochaetia bacterium]